MVAHISDHDQIRLCYPNHHPDHSQIRTYIWCKHCLTIQFMFESLNGVCIALFQSLSLRCSYPVVFKVLSWQSKWQVGFVVLHGITKSVVWSDKSLEDDVTAKKNLLLGILTIWFLQTVVQVKFTWSKHNKQNISKMKWLCHKCGVLPPSRNVWHEISHSEIILEISVFTWQKFH